MELRHQGSQSVSAFSAELVAIYRHFGMFERNTVCCGSVTVPQCAALQLLLDPAEEHDITALATQMGVTKSAATRLVDGMEKRGWVERVRDTKDRRRVMVQHTEAGREEAMRLRRLTLESIAAVMKNIPAAEHEAVLRAMKLVRVALDRARANRQISCC